jgi:two-component system nitrate/nitrite response regulator NarL
MTNVLIVDDTRLYREGLADILMRERRVDAVETAADPAAAVHQLITSSPDVVLLNTAMTDCTEILHRIADAAERVPVVVLGVSESETDVIAWAEAGVAGYLFKTGSLADLVGVIHDALRGEVLCPPRLTGALLRRLAALAAERRPHIETARLTAREREILELIDDGLSNKDIARHLSIEVRTVKNHVHNILEKLRVHRRGEAAAQVRAARASLRI